MDRQSGIEHYLNRCTLEVEQADPIRTAGDLGVASEDEVADCPQLGWVLSLVEFGLKSNDATLVMGESVLDQRS
jgi:hypothetical protein